MKKKRWGNPLGFRPTLCRWLCLGSVIRSGVAPQRCPLSYTGAKLEKVLETTKTFRKKFVKSGKVSHDVGHLCTYLDVKTYTSSECVS